MTRASPEATVHSRWQSHTLILYAHASCSQSERGDAWAEKYCGCFVDVAGLVCGRNVCSGESVAKYNSRPLQCKISRYDYMITTIIVLYRITFTRSHLYGYWSDEVMRTILCIYNLYYCPHASGPGDDGEIPEETFSWCFRLPGAPESRIVQHGLSRVVNIHFIKYIV